MNIYQKLQTARIDLQSMELKKSGENKFSGYFYFELGDFLPQTQLLFKTLGMCGTVSFNSDLATLTIVDSDKPDSSIVFTSPMGTAALKGMHEIQNIGAVETYQRRYLWVTAMEIVEHDAVDMGSGDQHKSDKKAVIKSEKITNQSTTAADALILAQMNACTAVSALVGIMNSIPSDQKKFYTAHFGSRKTELTKGA